MGRATSAEEGRGDKVDREQISSFFPIYLLMIHKFHNLLIGTWNCFINKALIIACH
jgi:hypothetical protein